MGTTKRTSDGELITYDPITDGYRREVVIVDRDGNVASGGGGGGGAGSGATLNYVNLKSS